MVDKIEDKKTFVEEEQNEFSEGEDLTPEVFMEGSNNFIKAPAVGDSVEFVLKGVKQQKARKVKNPKTGNMMDIKLSGDGVDYYYDFIADDDKVFSCSTWQLVGKTRAIVKKLGKFGFKLKIEHVADGREISKDQDAWKVYAEVDGKFKELNKETNEWA